MSFLGQRSTVLHETTITGSDHSHVLRIVSYRFACGTVVPYLEVTEPGRSDTVRIVAISEAVHALLNLGEDELFQVGNREQAGKP